MRTFSRGIVSAFLWICGTFFFAGTLFAQAAGNSGTVSGTVTDPTGAVIPGATVSIQNPVSQYGRTVTTDKTGHFQFTNVPLNPYHVAVSMAGFSTVEHDVDVAFVVPWTANTPRRVGEASNTTVVVTGEDLLENDSTMHTDIDRSLF